MNTARISSTRSLPTICLTLLLGIAAHSLTPANADPPADPSAKPSPNKDFAGTWRGKINGADSRVDHGRPNVVDLHRRTTDALYYRDV